MPMALLALAALQTGFSMYSQQQQIRAANKAQKRATRDSIENRNELLAERAGTTSTLLGGNTASMEAQKNSEQGTILTSTRDNKRSLLG